VRRSDKQRLAEHFRANPSPADFPLPPANYNVAPTTHQPIIRQSRETGARELILARWGLVPFFAKDLKALKGLSSINARAETIATWRKPMKKRRCPIPVNAFYEWLKKASLPAAIRLRVVERKSVCLCQRLGCLEGRRPPLASVVRHRDNGSKRAYGKNHPRMPVILHPRD
jgi:putative SOS response-associated peptidase YedK